VVAAVILLGGRHGQAPHENTATVPSVTDRVERALLADFQAMPYIQRLNADVLAKSIQAGDNSYSDTGGAEAFRQRVSCVRSAGSEFACTHTIDGRLSRYHATSTAQVAFDEASGRVVVTSETADGVPFPAHR
jgi:hypothetical protein